MVGRRIIAFIMAIFMLVILTRPDAFAGQKSRSGSYQGRNTGGSWQQNVTRTPGHVERSTTWQNERGQGSRTAEISWNKETGTGSYSSAMTRADGRTTMRQGTVTQTGEGAYTVEGTRSGPGGRVAEVHKSITKNPDGTSSVHSIYTGPEGRTWRRSIQRTRDGNTVRRDVNAATPDGQTRSHTESLTVDAPAASN